MVHTPHTPRDTAWLERWIQPQHLEADRLAHHRDALGECPSRTLVLDRFLPDALADDVARFLCERALFRPSYGVTSIRGEATAEDWRRAEESERLYVYQVLDEAQWDDPSTQAAAQHLFGVRAAFEDPRFTAWAEAATGMALGPDTEVGIHGLQHGDFLHRHRDVGNRRALAFLLYLAPDWRADHGGALRLVDFDDRTESVVPRFNRLILFDVYANQWHEIEPVTPAAGDRRRVSIGGWCHLPAGVEPG